MSIVDLAGSERSRKTQASGQVIKEAGNINVSLHILSKCINAMRHTNKCVCVCVHVCMQACVLVCVRACVHPSTERIVVMKFCHCSPPKEGKVVCSLQREQVDSDLPELLCQQGVWHEGG